jgi:hypothetical protein
VTAARAPALEGVPAVGPKPGPSSRTSTLSQSWRWRTPSEPAPAPWRRALSSSTSTISRTTPSCTTRAAARLEVETQPPPLECQPWPPVGLELVGERSHVRLRIGARRVTRQRRQPVDRLLEPVDLAPGDRRIGP